MSGDEVYDHARKRVEAKIGFYIHLGVFICICSLMIGVNLAMTPENLWFVWPVVGWGIGVFLHGLSVFLFASGGKVKERMIEKEIERQERRHIPYTGRDDEPV